MVKQRRMSVVGDGGEVSWIKSDFTALVCPATQQAGDMSDVSAAPVMSSDLSAGITNKKQRIHFKFVSDQSTPEDSPVGNTTT